MCNIYSAALAAATQGLPWIRAADVWHISSIPDHKTIFKAEPPLAEEESFNRNDNGTPTHGTQEDAGISDEIIDSGGTGSSGGARFCERIIGKTWSGSPAVILRSLRTPGRDEAVRAARWLRWGGEECDGVFGDDECWTDHRLRLLADEWKICAGLGTKKYGIAKIGSDTRATSHPATAAPRVVAGPFMVHTGHLIVPFLNGSVQKKGGGVIGHGVVLAVDRGVDWRRWESHLLDVAVAATQCFEQLEREGEVAEKARSKAWAGKILHRGSK